MLVWVSEDGARGTLDRCVMPGLPAGTQQSTSGSLASKGVTPSSASSKPSSALCKFSKFQWVALMRCFRVCAGWRVKSRNFLAPGYTVEGSRPSSHNGHFCLQACLLQGGGQESAAQSQGFAMIRLPPARTGVWIAYRHRRCCTDLWEQASHTEFLLAIYWLRGVVLVS